MVKLLTLARDLTRRKAREKQALFVAEGVRCVEELVRSSLTVEGALVAPQLADAPRGPALLEALRARTRVEDVGHAEFASAAETESPQGVLAIARIPDHSISDLPPSGPLRVLVLDAVQDPGNVGTILRTAAALGASATVALPGTVDLWNAKVVRSSMGAHFTHRAFSITWDELDSFRGIRHPEQREGSAVALWGTAVGGDDVRSVTPPGRLALVVGNEGAGLSEAARSRVQRTVSLPIQGVESLNVAVATGILLFELAPRA